MSRSKRKPKRNKDLWKPGALSGIAHNTANKRLTRRIQRKRDKKQEKPE